MAIDWAATKRKFDESPYMQKKVARSIGVSGTLLNQMLHSVYPHMDSPRAKSVVAKLEELGVLVRDEDSKQAA